VTRVHDDAAAAPRGVAAAISGKGVSKVFRRGGTEVHALDQLDIEVADGEFVAVLGPSGCGKSTLMRLVAGLVPATTGRIAIAGVPVHGPHTDLGIVFQAATLLDWRTVLGNVLLQIELRGLDPKAYEARAVALLQAVGLGDFTGAFPRELSGGMKQRAAIVRALVHDPKILLMDEPFGALDALTREKMNLELLRIWKESRKTIVFVTHGISEAVFLGTRVIVMTAGPARMADNFPIELPHPRTLDMKTHERFGEYTRRIYRLLGLE